MKIATSVTITFKDGTSTVITEVLEDVDMVTEERSINTLAKRYLNQELFHKSIHLEVTNGKHSVS